MSLPGPKPFLSATPRQIVMIIIGFGSFFAWYGYVEYQLRSHRAELNGLADKEADQYFSNLDRTQYDVVTNIESAREFGLIGSEWGNARILMRKKDDATMKSFLGLEYFYRHDGNAWIRTDMAKMDDPAFWPEAYDQFVAQGYTVEPEAYDRALDRK